MRVLVRDHLGLRMTGIALYGFHIAAVQLQLVGNAGMAKTVEDYLRQIILLNQLIKELIDPSMLHRCSKRTGNYQLIVMILTAKLLLCHFLIPFPTDQHLSNCSGKIDSSRTGEGLRLFKDKYRSCSTRMLRKHAENIFLFQCFHRTLSDPLQLFIDKDGSLSFCQAFFRNIHAVPGQAEQLADSQRAGERQIDRQLQAFIFTDLQCVKQRIGIPDITCLFFNLWDRRQLRRIFLDQFPLHRLRKSTI